MRFSNAVLVAVVMLAAHPIDAAQPMFSERAPDYFRIDAGGRGPDIPLIDWSVPQFLGGNAGVTSSMGATFLGNSKSASAPRADLGMSAFTAVPPCRLVDTRNAFSPAIPSPGPFAAGEVRTYLAAGNCGLPVGSNRIKAISIAITTLPATTSGDVETVPHGAALGGTVDMVVQAGQWNSVSKIVRVDSSGSFDMQLRLTSGHLAIDINGYFADVNAANTNDFYSVKGKYSVDGGLLYSENASALGGAIRAFNSDPALGTTAGDVRLAQGANAIDIAGGQIRVRNAGVGTSTPAFIHQIDAANLCTDARYTQLDEAHVAPPNASAGQMLFVQEAAHAGTADTSTPKRVRTVFLTSFNCDGVSPLANAWYLFSDVAFAANETYNVLVINP